MSLQVLFICIRKAYTSALVLKVNVGKSYSSIFIIFPSETIPKQVNVEFMYKYEEPTQIFRWSRLQPRLVLQIA